MSFKNELICEEFSRELWKLLDGTLPANERAFWEKHMASCAECSVLFEETEKALAFYESVPTEDISEEKFNRMIDSLERPRPVSLCISNIRNGITWLTGGLSFLRYKKTVFALSFSLTLVMLILIYKPAKVSSTGSEQTGIRAAGAAVENSTSSEMKDEIQIGPQKETAFEAPAEAKRETGPGRIFIQWDTDNVSSGIRQVSNSIEGMEAGLGRSGMNSENWMMSAAEMISEIERLEKELKDSAF